MSGIKPFKAVLYNKDKIGNITKVVSPPYDVITPEQQADLHALSPYNFTHIDLAKEKPNDTKENNQYTRARKILDDWLKKEIMVEDNEPAVYFYKQDYKFMGQKHTRLGFISLLELEDDEEANVKAHEKTHAHAVDDRLKLTKALHSNLSCIFVCYSDKHKKMEKIFNKHVISTDPLYDLEDKDRVHHKLWRLTDPKMINEIASSVKGQEMYIADGHHRYKVANEYRRQRMSRKPTHDGTEDFNFVMTYFTNMDSKDLQIFPVHRVVKKVPKSLDFLENYFRIDKVKTKQDLLILLAKAGRNEHAFGLYTRDGIKLLRLKNKTMIEKHIKTGSKEYKNLDYTIIKHLVLDKLGVKSEDLFYVKSLEEATAMVDESEAEAGFIMNSVKISELKAIAHNGERMPPKSTYFYPKVLSGLTVYKMD